MYSSVVVLAICTLLCVAPPFLNISKTALLFSFSYVMLLSNKAENIALSLSNCYVQASPGVKRYLEITEFR